MAKHVTDSFERNFGDRSYIVMEVEKYFDVIIFYKKKRYAGIYHEPEESGESKLMTKGLELVRRDSIPITRATQEQVLAALLYNKDALEAVEVVGRSLQRILDMTTMDDIVQSKSLKARYKAPDSLPHVRLRDLMAQREPGSEPRVGDRVYFVFVASSSDKLFEKVESMEYAKEQALPMDKVHYINALEKPIMNLLEIPLGSMNRSLLLDLRRSFDNAKDRAYSYVTNNAMTRRSNGAWVRGHATKGGVQTVIPCLEPVPCPRPKKKTRVVKNEGQRSLFEFM